MQVKKAVVHTQELNPQPFLSREMLYQELVCKLPFLGHEVFVSLPDRYPAQVIKAFNYVLYPLSYIPKMGMIGVEPITSG